jgi:hypothetical protein
MTFYSRTVKTLAIHFFTFALYAFWQFQDKEWAGNLLRFMLFIIGLLGICAFFVTASGSIPPRLRYLERISQLFHVLTVIGMAAAGSFIVATLYMVGMFGLASYRKQFDDEGQLIKKEAADGAPVNG